MKAKIFLGLTAGIAAITTAAIVTVSSVNASSTPSLLMQNLEALSLNEEGTAVGTCHFRNSYSADEPTSEYPCDYRTNTSTIYPCPSWTVLDKYAGSDRCTK